MSPQAIFQSGPGGKLPIAPSGQIAVSVLCVRTDSSTYCVIDVIFAFRHWLTFMVTLSIVFLLQFVYTKKENTLYSPGEINLKVIKVARTKFGFKLTMMLLHHIID